jgi:hypothetical protein
MTACRPLRTNLVDRGPIRSEIWDSAYDDSATVGVASQLEACWKRGALSALRRIAT